MRYLNTFETYKPYKKITNKPVIRLNNGNLVCLCTQCSKIIERVKYNKDKEWETLIGGEVPLLCNDCRNKTLLKENE